MAAGKQVNWLTEYLNKKDPVAHIISELESKFNNRCLTGKNKEKYEEGRRGQYGGGKDTSLAVVTAQTEEELQHLLQLANNLNFVIIPQGGNTNLTGCGNPRNPQQNTTGRPQVILTLGGDNFKKKSYDEGTGIATFGPAVAIDEANKFLKPYGKSLPVYLTPHASAQIEGLVSTNAGGEDTPLNGSAAYMVSNINWISPLGIKKDHPFEHYHPNKRESIYGNISSTQDKCLKTSMGAIENTPIGAEGTLGIITEVQIHPAPIIKDTTTTVLGFKDIASMQLFKMELCKNNKAPIRFEYFPQETAEFINNKMRPYANKLDPKLKEGPWQEPIILLCQTPLSMASDLSNAISSSTSQNYQCNTDESNTIWDIRTKLPSTQNAHFANRKMQTISTDFCLPFNCTANFPNDELLKKIQTIAPEAQVFPFGHAFEVGHHYNVYVSQETFQTKYHQIGDLIYQEVQKLGGVPSAEHGIGTRHHLLTNYPTKNTPSEEEIQEIRRHKKQEDPNDICNAGVMFPSFGKQFEGPSQQSKL